MKLFFFSFPFNQMQSTYRFISDNKVLTCAVVGGVVPVATPIVIGALGFGASGIGAGTVLQVFYYSLNNKKQP